MGLGTMIMEQLERENHVGYCNHCREWTAFTKTIAGAYICPMCGNFGSPGYNTKKERDTTGMVMQG